MPRILIADDSPVVRESIATALRSVGYDVVVATNGKNALVHIRNQPVDLILLDVHMPEMDGLAMLRRLRKIEGMQKLPVLLLTEASDRTTVVEAASLGVQHYLLKSRFSMDDLFSRVRTELSGDTSPPTDATPPATSPNAPDTTVASNAAHPSMESASTVNARTHAVDHDPEQVLKERKPLLSRSDLNERIESCTELRAMSPTVAQVVKLAQSPNASIEAISKAIRSDQGIALKILQLANSAAYAHDDPVDSIEKAVIRIGLKTIGQAVMNITVIDQFSSESERSDIDPRLFWEHSIGCGLIAARLAAACQSTEPNIAFTMGLIHDVGRLVFAEVLGETYHETLQAAEELQLPIEVVESRLLLQNHADGMDRILHQWKFPRDLIDPIVFHHLSIGNIRRVAPKRLAEVATLALANRLAHALMLGSSGNDAIYSTHEFCEALKIDPRAIADIESKVRDETSDLKMAMLSAVAGNAWPSVRARVRQQLDMSFRPVFVCTHPETDAFRIFCNQLAERSDDPPNIAIVHITDNRERVPLATALRKAEAEANVENLPLVTLSPTGKLNIESGALANRSCECLATPVVITRLLACFKNLLESPATARAA